MTGVFEMMTGPYIPAEHVPLDVLPWNREEGYEVFSYPPELNDVDDALFEAEGLNRNERGTRTALIYPYGYHSYGEYFAHLQGYVDKSKKATANSKATQIRSAALTAITEALYKTKDSAALASCSAGKVIKFSELNDSNPIDAEIKTLIDGNIVLADSMLYFEYDSSRDEITFAQFQKDEKSPIGQSPIPKDNAAVEKLGVMQE